MKHCFNVKRITLTCLFMSMSIIAFGQQEEEKISYLTVSGSVGSSSLNYKLNSLNEKGTRNSQLGYGFDVRYSYFFNSHWGLTTGIGMSHYSTKGKLKGSMTAEADPANPKNAYTLGNFIDDDAPERPREFQLRTRVTNLEEKQTAWMLEVPIMGMYQTRFGEEETWGMYGGLGVKLQFPVSTKFKIQNGANSEFNVSGYYKDIPTDMGAPGEPPVPQHGYGTITNPNESLDWDGKNKLKMGVAGTAELGFMVNLGSDMDLMLGGYIDYGFIDMKKNDKGLFTAAGSYQPGANNYVGKGIEYNGMLDSNVTDKVKPMAFGVKLGLRFKL